ncbi:signal transduction histidine kinase [Streptomyces sp. 1114.5]|uniref:sensor histidine kinase n=1 Tax=Streptomyces sp. 1114.5 TaxID=1938830 RepID=UPI000F2CFC1C|nr:histidine kinase [Streptomyces sp. 1114.5]RKT11630.1 signal transduction histidine kinase [Streptomyces sp. 1114.5]
MRRMPLGWYGPEHRPWTDTLLLLGVLGLTAEEALAQWLHSDGPLRVPRTVVAALASLSLLFARRCPVASAVLPVLTGGLLNRAFPGLFSVFHLAHLGRPGPAVVGGAVIAVGSATGAESLVGWAGTTGSQLLVQAATLSFGLWLHGRRALIRTLHQQVDALRRERELRADQARAAERGRIAREMHDVLAHRLSLLVLHAGVLRDQARAGTLAADQDRLTHRLELLRTTAARSLDDLRDVLGALRADPPTHDARATGAEPEVSGGPAPVPAPALRDLTELVDEATQAGQQVELALSGDSETVPTTHRLAVHRLVQEALTNARKYAPAAPVIVRVGYGAPTTTVEVRNGPGAALPEEPVGGSGYGLVGLSERVAALGGHLDAGPDGSGGFRLSARLPASERLPRPVPEPVAAPTPTPATAAVPGPRPGTGGPPPRPQGPERPSRPPQQPKDVP